MHIAQGIRSDDFDSFKLREEEHYDRKIAGREMKVNYGGNHSHTKELKHEDFLM
jgi:hypothetical protein